MPKRNKDGTPYYSGKMQWLRNLFGNKCMVLDDYHEGQLEFAHIVDYNPLGGREKHVKGEGRGLWKRYHDIKKHPDEYVLVCHYHHIRLDAGISYLFVNDIPMILTPLQ